MPSHILVSIVFQESTQILQACNSNLAQQSGELVLPFLTMCQDSCLQGRAIKKDKLNVEYSFLSLHIVGNFSVSEHRNC